jgi:hypothetical protein
MRCRCVRPATLLLACQIVAAADEAASAQLTWHGSPDVGKAQIVRVNWGDNVRAAVPAGMPALYGDDTTHVVTPSAGTHGSIAPDTPQAVASGQTAAFTVTPDTGYAGAVGGTCGGSLEGTTYTTAPVTADCSVEATFPLDSIFDSGFEPPLTPQQFAAFPGSLFDGLPVCIPPISANVSGYQVTACQAPQMCTPAQAGCLTTLHAQAATLSGSLASGGYDVDTPATADSFTSAIDFAGLVSCHVTADSIGGHIVASYAAIPDYAGCARIDALDGAEATAVNAALSSSDCGIYSGLIAYVQPYVVAQLQTELTNQINALLPKPDGPGVGDTICPAP